MKAISLHAPWGSLIAIGTKRVETRSWPCPPSIIGTRVAFHQAKKMPPSWLRVGDYRIKGFGRTGLALEGPGLPEFRSVPRLEGFLVPLGCIVASGVITRSLPIVAPVPIGQLERTETVVQVGPESGWLAVINTWPRGGDVIDVISDQLPYGTFTPGRWAWELSDVAAVTDRCPICWSSGSAAPEDEEWDQRYTWGSCETCAGAGVVEPIPAKGKQGFWNWEVDDG